MHPDLRPPAGLAPATALGYLRELSCDGLAGVVLTSDGDRLAGPPVPARAAVALGRALAPGEVLHARGDSRQLFAAASPRHVVLAATGPLALPGLVAHDLRDVLAMLDGPVSRAPAAGDPGDPAAARTPAPRLARARAWADRRGSRLRRRRSSRAPARDIELRRIGPARPGAAPGERDLARLCADLLSEPGLSAPTRA